MSFIHWTFNLRKEIVVYVVVGSFLFVINIWSFLFVINIYGVFLFVMNIYGAGDETLMVTHWDTELSHCSNIMATLFIHEMALML